jgi:GNAT superfamily N-acetyltransferase
VTVPIDARSLRPSEADAADRLFRLAFGTFLGLPDPMSFRPGAAIFPHRLATYPDGAVAVYEDDELIGAAIANRWGQVGVIGPVVVAPSHWNRGVGRILVNRTVAQLEEWGCKSVRLATFPHSAGHLRFYQRYGFWPTWLSASMMLPVNALEAPGKAIFRTELLSRLANSDASNIIASCAELSAQAEAGLDWTAECVHLLNSRAGDVVALIADERVVGFAICATGDGSEAGSGNCLIKAALVRDLAGDPVMTVGGLFAAVSAFASSLGLTNLIATVSTGNLATYRAMLANGFVAQIHQIVMSRSTAAKKSDSNIHVFEDLR